jgi:hypothetical protein
MDWQPPSTFANRKDSMAATQEQFQDLHIPRSSLAPFMLYVDEDETVSDSLFEKVIDTVNAAKDIAYINRNASWRR